MMKQIRPPLKYLKDNWVIIDTSHLLAMCLILDDSGPGNEWHTLQISCSGENYHLPDPSRSGSQGEPWIP